MKYAVISLALLTFIAACALDLLPEDEKKIAGMKAELKQCEDQVVKLQKEIAAHREKIARESSAASVRALEVKEKTGEAVNVKKSMAVAA